MRTGVSTFDVEPLPLEYWQHRVYLADSARGQCLGRLAAAGMDLALAAVALPNPESLALHRACGFEEMGVMREVGHKFDRWIDLQWLQRFLVR